MSHLLYAGCVNMYFKLMFMSPVLSFDCETKVLELQGTGRMVLKALGCTFLHILCLISKQLRDLIFEYK